MAPGYLNPSTLVAVKYMATEALHWRALVGRRGCVPT